MRRLLALIVIPVLAVAAVACSGSSDDADSSATTATSTAATSSESPATTAIGTGGSTTTTGSSEAGAGGGGGATDHAGNGNGNGDSGAPLELRAAASSLGQVVVDGDGRTLYVYVNDGATSCPPGCEAQWPPLVGSVTAGAGITAALGSKPLGSGAAQATIAGRPLYYYAGDTEPGASSGQGVGGTWFVVNGAGDPVTTP